MVAAATAWVTGLVAVVTACVTGLVAVAAACVTGLVAVATACVTGFGHRRDGLCHGLRRPVSRARSRARRAGGRLGHRARRLRDRRGYRLAACMTGARGAPSAVTAPGPVSAWDVPLTPITETAEAARATAHGGAPANDQSFRPSRP